MTDRPIADHRITQPNGVSDVGAGRVALLSTDDMGAPIVILEVDPLRPPVDPRVVVVEPRHAEDDIVARERKRHEIERIGVRTDADCRRLHEGGGLLLTAVCESDDTGSLQLRREETVFGDEVGGDEIVGGTGVEQGDCRVASDCSSETEEFARDVGELVDLRWEARCDERSDAMRCDGRRMGGRRGERCEVRWWRLRCEWRWRCEE